MCIRIIVQNEQMGQRIGEVEFGTLPDSKGYILATFEDGRRHIVLTGLVSQRIMRNMTRLRKDIQH